MRSLLPLPALLLALSACAPATLPGGAVEAPRGPVQTVPAVQTATEFQRDLGPHRGTLEWWYVSSSLPASGVALHWALFKLEVLGRTILITQSGLTDLGASTFRASENGTQAGAALSFPPLRAAQAGGTLSEQPGPEGTPAAFTLRAPDLDLTLTPQKPAVRHPASGTPETGQMEYQSVTRLNIRGTVRTADGPRTVDGPGWLDHQWGDQLPGQGAFWDWMGLQLSDGSELMLYRVRDAAGTVLQTYGTHVAPDGTPVSVVALTLTPTRTWTSATGRRYSLDWTVRADDLSLKVSALRDAQELTSSRSPITYWEGPVAVTGQVGVGRAITGSGMGEFIAPPP